MNKRVLTKLNKYNYFAYAAGAFAGLVWFMILCVNGTSLRNFLLGIPPCILLYATRLRYKKTFVVACSMVLVENVALLIYRLGSGAEAAAAAAPGSLDTLFCSLAAAVCCLAALLFMRLFVYEGEEDPEGQPKRIVRIKYAKGMTAAVADFSEGTICPRCGEEYTPIRYVTISADEKKRLVTRDGSSAKCAALQHEGGLCRNCHFSIKKHVIGIVDLFLYLFAVACILILLYPAHLAHTTGSQIIESRYLILIYCVSIGCIPAILWMYINKLLAAEWRGVRIRDEENFRHFIWQLKRDKRNDPNLFYLSEKKAKKHGLIS